jgi:hypothetical protein
VAEESQDAIELEDEPRILEDRAELEEPIRRFAALDRKVRGFRATLARQLAKVAEAMSKRLDPAQAERDKLGREIARTALANRALVAGDKTEAVFEEGLIVFYDGQLGEFKVLKNDELALMLIELGHKELVTIGSAVTYTIARPKLKALVKADLELREALSISGMATYTENKTVTVEASPTPQERSKGVKLDGYVHHYD